MNIFYVYVYMDPRKPGDYMFGKYSFDCEPFYVGKGRGERYLKHLRENGRSRKVNKIKAILNENLKPVIVKFKECLTEQEAFDLEIDMIKTIGRLDLKTGPLCNHTDGGEGFSGLIRTEEHRRKIIESNKGKTLGRKLTDEQKKKISEKLKGKSTWNKGKTLPEEMKKKISKGNIGKHRSKEVCEKMSYNAKHRSDIHKANLKKSQIGKIFSEETRIKLSNSLKGRKNTKEQIEKWKLSYYKRKNSI